MRNSATTRAAGGAAGGAGADAGDAAGLRTREAGHGPTQASGARARRECAAEASPRWAAVNAVVRRCTGESGGAGHGESGSARGGEGHRRPGQQGGPRRQLPRHTHAGPRVREEKLTLVQMDAALASWSCCETEESSALGTGSACGGPASGQAGCGQPPVQLESEGSKRTLLVMRAVYRSAPLGRARFGLTREAEEREPRDEGGGPRSSGAGGVGARPWSQVGDARAQGQLVLAW